MNIALFTAKSYDKYYFDQQLSETDHEITYFEDALNTDTAVLARGYDTVCVFVNNIISLHCPLMPETKHMIDKKAIDKMNDSPMLINTSRGALVKTSDVIDGLKEKKIGSLGIDVYEQEENLFFQDLSEEVIQDDEIARLMTFPNVLITGHQAFLTKEALNEIAKITLQNLTDYEAGKEVENRVEPQS